MVFGSTKMMWLTGDATAGGSVEISTGVGRHETGPLSYTSSVCPKFV